MRSRLLLFALLACSSEKPEEKLPLPDGVAQFLPPEAPATPAPVRVDAPGGVVRYRMLDHLADARFTFPEGATGSTATGEFVLAGNWKDEGVRKGGWHQYSTPLPFATTMPRPNYSPMGARLYHDGAEIAFDTSISEPSTGPKMRWWVDRGRVMLLAAENPKTWPTALQMKVPELTAALAKRNFATSGLSAAEFARTAHTEGRVTRPGLLLPAPGTAQFDVPLPARARLRFGTALLADPVTNTVTGDGAALEVRVDGTSVWSGRTDGPHQDVVVDLPEGTPRTATVEFVTSPGTTGEGDAVVFTAPYVADAGAAAPRRVVVVGVDTLRWDALSANGAARATSPELDRWLAQSAQFTRAYSPAPRTKPSFRTAFSGRYPSAGGTTNIAEVLAGQGFATAGVVANVHLVPRFGFNRGMDHWEYDNGAKADDQVDRALAWAKAHQDEDSYLFVHIMDPHTVYEAKGAFKGHFQGEGKRPKAVPARFNRWSIYALMKKDRLTDNGKAWIRAAYDEEVAFAAHEISRLFSELESLPGQTLTVLHSDHGEEFWDHRAFEHNHSVYDELVHTVLAVRPPKGWAGAPKIDTPVGLVDIAPTVYDFVGVPADARPLTDGVSLRAFADPERSGTAATLAATLADRPHLLGHMRYGRDRWGVIYQQYKYILHTSSGVQEVYDLVADPREEHNLYDKGDAALLTTLRAALEKASGWPTRAGYRVRVPSTAAPLSVTFDAPILAAGVLDPELNVEVRANLEWGERPERLPEEVGTVVVAEDHRSLVFTPGPKTRGGALYVQCEAAPCPTGTFTAGPKSGKFEGSRNLGGSLYVVEPGTLLVPHDRSDNPEEGTAATDAERDQLEALGYLEDEHEGDDE